jgi:hypothetical protein
MPEAAVTSDIRTDLAAAGNTLSELHTGPAYLASDLVRQRGDDLIVYCKTWRVRYNQVTAPGAWARARIKREIRANWWPIR